MFPRLEKFIKATQNLNYYHLLSPKQYAKTTKYRTISSKTLAEALPDLDERVVVASCHVQHDNVNSIVVNFYWNA